MEYLKAPGQAAVLLNKPYFSIGEGPGFDLSFPANQHRILFTVHREEDKWLLTPGTTKVWVNGRAVTRGFPLSPCDRIEWKEGTAVYLDSILTASEPEEKASLKKCWQLLEELASFWEGKHSFSALMHRTLESLVETAGAEGGYILSELGSPGKWDLLAAFGGEPSEERRRNLISNTVLAHAVEKREAIHVESLIGHPWEQNASLIGARLFSIACLPLGNPNHIFGCVYLYTETPGHSIEKAILSELRIFATQATLLLAARKEVERARRAVPLSERLQFTETSPVKDVMNRVAKLGPSTLNILVFGETGTGKELVAKEIHHHSERTKGPFVAVNCGAIPATLIESTLFGHTKGAFTGATQETPGKFQQAHHGTLFLDEIGDLPLELQVKLLRVLQEKAVEPIGSQKQVPVDFRLVCATHRNIEQLVREGKFREDLFYRLNGATLSLPPLRERPDDIPFLANIFGQRMGSTLSFSSEAMARLKSHSWPGNVRELEQVVSRAVVLCEEAEIQIRDLEMGTSHPLDVAWDYLDLKQAQADFTAELVERTLEKAQGNRTLAAQKLGVSERTLYRLIADRTV